MIDLRLPALALPSLPVPGLHVPAVEMGELPFEPWLRSLFPEYLTHPFAPRHRDLWEWAWSIRRGVRARPFVAIWPRGGAKSTTAELAAVALGARRKRGYCWYICATQDQADKHVENAASMLESAAVEKRYPEVAQRRLGKYGHSSGWRRQRLRSRSGYTIDALGLDRAARGSKVEMQRPDLMIFDDIDERHDTEATTRKKIETITTSLLPAGSGDVAVLMIQNQIVPDGVFSQLADGRADFLLDRIVSGPYPAVDGLEYEQRGGAYVITAGEPTWAGQDLEVCQSQIDTWGISAFLRESQHAVHDVEDGMFSHLSFVRCAPSDVPDLVRVAVWVDPAVTATDKSDAVGIQADGIAADGTVYRLRSWEDVTTPEDALRRAISWAVELGADTVGVETDQGGDAWRSVYKVAWQQMRDSGRVGNATAPRFRQGKAGAGHGPKVERASRMLAAYEQGRFVHVRGTHDVLEKALRRFPVRKPYDLCDAAYWSWVDLTGPVRSEYPSSLSLRTY